MLGLPAQILDNLGAPALPPCTQLHTHNRHALRASPPQPALVAVHTAHQLLLEYFRALKEAQQGSPRGQGYSSVPRCPSGAHNSAWHRVGT